MSFASHRKIIRRRFLPRLEMLEQRLALATFTVLNTADSGAGSLRQAILDANANSGADLIDFNIGGGGVQTISPTSALPTITDPVIVDGWTQPGFAGSPIIELNGENAGSASGLTITAGNSTVRGLVINRFQFVGGFMLDGLGNGIVLSTGDGNVIEGNYIGTDVTGAIGLGNQRLGILIFAGSSGNYVGTDGDGFNDDAERNVISGNGTIGNSSSGVGVAIQSVGTDNNMVAGNYIGADVTGAISIGNTSVGVAIQRGAKGNRIGSDGSNDDDPATSLVVEDFNVNERNVISGNLGTGVVITSEGTENNTVAGNNIGVDATGAAPLGNTRFGVNIFQGAGRNSIGGTSAALANKIAFNVLSGVQVLHASAGAIATGNRIQGNSIHSNGFAGIELTLTTGPGGDGVTPNDLGDGDTGPNNLQNFPELDVAHSGPETFVSGTLNSLPDTVFTLDFYSSPDADPSGHGEGERYLGSATVGTDVNGDVSFEVLLDAATLGGEKFITATATDPDGNTSEFSAGIPVTTLIIDGTIADESYVIGRHETGAIEVSVFGVSQGAASQVFINDPDGEDDYTVNFAGWEGFVTINDMGAIAGDTLTVNGTLESDVIDKTGDQITFGGPVTETVFYSGIDNVVVDGLGGNDIITDPGTNTTILGGDGDDTIIIDATVGNGVVVDGGEGSDSYVVMFGNLASPVTVADSGATGVDSLTVQGTPAAESFTLTGNQVQSGSETVIIASPIANLTVEGGGGSNTTTIAGFTASISTLTVDGSTGTNAVTIQGDPPPGVTLNLVAAVQTVQIDVRPQSLNLASNGVIAVAMLTTASFNAALVDVGSVIFAGAYAVGSVLEDVDGDGDLDLVLHFRTQDTNLSELYSQLLADDLNEDGVLDSNDQEASISLTGSTLDDLAFAGFDQLDLFLSGKALRQMLADLAATGAI
jgi:hypothetical protein